MTRLHRTLLAGFVLGSWACSAPVRRADLAPRVVASAAPKPIPSAVPPKPQVFAPDKPPVPALTYEEDEQARSDASHRLSFVVWGLNAGEWMAR